ncbi:TetR/AcrR family transcriptional regulator [Peloplasma aerotolerans]|uniref:TetR/AcrR family transcriptional regulator n=1 Tax=Peloplasma aerotolerans TaxID=3044389 RepID=A0AAW6U9A2_9MOLU|nr:TetR/AcrR family transcriptional regulator [Mariniplasma sp. M4Ah]MDI6453254.1 TetR/AcrR family transcriptional regulator [Mariniplasma sp. M4Ah]
MPKDTFMNLPFEKQSLILDVAIKEFHDKGYDLASISSIVEKAQIAKGSFYQYFEGKDDLFKHIVVIINDKKTQFAHPVILTFDQLNFFDWFKKMLFATFEFLKSYPVLAKISVDFWKHSSTHTKERILGEEMNRTHEFLTVFIEKAVQKNELRNDISIEYLARYISSQLAFFNDYLLETYDDLTLVSEKNLEKIITTFLSILEHGTKNHS